MRIIPTTRGAGFLVASAVIFMLLAAAPTCAQTDFSGLKVKPGDMVWVTDASGATFGGRLAAEGIQRCCVVLMQQSRRV